jgi:hypothetical protein
MGLAPPTRLTTLTVTHRFVRAPRIHGVVQGRGVECPEQDSAARRPIYRNVPKNGLMVINERRFGAVRKGLLY